MYVVVSSSAFPIGCFLRREREGEVEAFRTAGCVKLALTSCYIGFFLSVCLGHVDVIGRFITRHYRVVSPITLNAPQPFRIHQHCSLNIVHQHHSSTTEG